MNSGWEAPGRSCWLSIMNEVRALQIKGVYIFDFLKHKMGNGESTKFWSDTWYEGGILKDLFPRLFALENRKEVTVSSKLSDINLVSSFRRNPRGEPNRHNWKIWWRWCDRSTSCLWLIGGFGIWRVRVSFRWLLFGGKLMRCAFRISGRRLDELSVFL